MDTFTLILDNTVVFIAMITILYVLPLKQFRNTTKYHLIIGAVLSLMALFVMMNSVEVEDGVFIDARYAIPIIAFAFFGLIPGVMVAVTIIIARIFILGGAGIEVGVVYVIFQSLVMYFYMKYYATNKSDSVLMKSIRLFLLSFVLQLILNGLAIIFLPSEIALDVVSNNFIYLVSIYPIIVFVFSILVGYREQYYDELLEGSVRDQYFELIINRTPNPLAIYDEFGNYIHLNEAWYNQSGYSKEDFSTVPEWLELVFPGQKFKKYINGETIYESVMSTPTIEYEIVRKDGSKRFWSFERKDAGTLPDGRSIFITTAKDVTVEKEYEKKLLYMSYRDFLTGLYNRRYFDEIYVKENKFHCENHFVIYGDMNNLKSLNDFYGHARGDEAIKSCAQVLKDVFNDGKTKIFRFGGDEFLLISDCAEKDDCLEKMDIVNDRLSEKDFGEVSISISLGIHKVEAQEKIEDAIMKAESRMYEYKIFDSTSARSGTIDVILTMLFEKDPETERHSKRVREIAGIFARELDLDSNETSLLLRASLLHDIGKILIPTHILLSKEKLTDEQYDIVKKHSFLGYRILSSKGTMQSIGEIVLTHHEHMDGTGYPNGLKGKDIPKIARILNIIDAFEAMTSDRPYRNRQTYEHAISELERCKGTQFDQELVDKFIPIVPQIPEFKTYKK